MPQTEYRGRRAVQIENDRARVTVTVEGGHIAEILHKAANVNPLWSPPWTSIEPSAYDPKRHPEYGLDAESKLLAGIMGHNLCLDLFGGPSPEEASAGITVHGEASVNPYEIDGASDRLTMRTRLDAAQLAFERRITLEGDRIRIHETVENLSALDRPIAWTQHVTLGPPFVEHGRTRFELTATKSKTFEESFGETFAPGAEFEWPFARSTGGRHIDLRTYTDAPSSAGFTTHLMDRRRPDAWFAAWSPKSRVLFGYRWKRADFPWCGIWEENQYRQQPPWNGHTITRGMEFGVSPIPESRRKMIDRANLFGVPTYRWIPARTRLEVDYEARITTSETGELAALFG